MQLRSSRDLAFFVQLIESRFKQMDVDDVEELRKQEMFVMMQDVNRWLQSGVVGECCATIQEGYATI